MVAAIVKCNQLIAQKPEKAELHAQLGNLYAQQQQWPSAIASYQRAIQLDATVATVYYNLANVLSKIGEMQQAADFLYQGLQLDPTLGTVQKYQALAEFFQEGKPERAIVCWQQAIALQADCWQAYYQLGMVWQRQQQWSQAVTAYEQVKQINPQFIPNLQQLAKVYRTLGKYESAIDCYHQLLRLAQVGTTIEREALENYQQILETMPQPTVQLYEQLGTLLRAKGYFSEALTAFQKAIAINPHFALAHINIQYTPANAEDLDKLIEFYRNLVEATPGIPIAWGNLGDALTQKNLTSEAIACYRKSSYQQAINRYPHLTQLDWSKTKQLPPDFAIIGASKSGTSSLYRYLSEHPQILLPHKKELDFFLRYFEQGIDWYLAHFPSICDRSDFITGEATPNYLRFPVVPQRIKQCCPQLKLIVLLRNPVERAVSWHYHKLNTGLAKGDLASAIATERERLQNLSAAELSAGGYHNPDNLLSSLYVYQLQPWIELLGRERFLILKSEDFYDHTADVMQRVFDFLGLPDCFLENYPQVNVGYYPPIDDNLRNTLVEYFQPYNQQLEAFLGMKFNWN